jgi:hypothetical protein
MTFGPKLRSRALLSSLPLLAACSSGQPLGVETATGGSGANGGSTSGGQGGSSATSAGGSSASGGSAAAGTSGASGMATGGTSGSAATGGSAGDTAATGGDTSAGGTGGVAASGGAGGTAAVGGTAGTGGTAAASAMGGTAGTDPGICQHLSAIATPQTPVVELVVDTSSSMFQTADPTAWSVLYEALDGQGGVVQALQDQIVFGFASYKGLMGSSETDAACATMTTVEPALMNYAAIDAVYKKLGADSADVAYTLQHPPPKWETPTNYAIAYAVEKLKAYNPMPPGPKYILLVTDGNPNTCMHTDPQCGQDLAIKAAQDAYAAGIGLFILGVGDIVVNPDNGCPTSARCGPDHLQDMANAGIGAPVQPAPSCDDPLSTDCQYRYSGCNANNTLLATYTPAAPDVGEPFAVDTSATDAPAKLKTALTALLSNAASCTFEMDVTVLGDPMLGIVTLDGAPVTYSAPDGWALDADAYHVTLRGSSCEAYKDGATVSIDFPCDPSGNPIAVHR